MCIRDRVKVVTANNVFSHSDNLEGIVHSVDILLKKNGLFIIEVSYAPDTITNGVFDYIYHEHLSYHSIIPLRKFFNRLGFNIFKVERVQTKGGSVRVFVARIGDAPFVDESVDQFCQAETISNFHSLQTFVKFRDYIAHAKSTFHGLLEQYKDLPLAGYGASATSTILLYQFDLGNHIQVIVDDFPERQGRFSPGFLIPTASPSSLLDNCFSVCVILSWRHSDLIINRNAKYRDAGGVFLLPLPVARVIKPIVNTLNDDTQS